MAKRVIQLLVDDLDGSDAAETVRFALDGVNYEIDLTTKNAAKLRLAMQPFVKVGAKLGRAAVPRAARKAGPSAAAIAASNRDQNRAIRVWAETKGLEVAERGRIPAEIVDRFHAEAGRPDPTGSAPQQRSKQQRSKQQPAFSG